eukprot:3937923-Rhodomonas_salina.1
MHVEIHVAADALVRGRKVIGTDGRQTPQAHHSRRGTRHSGVGLETRRSGLRERDSGSRTCRPSLLCGPFQQQTTLRVGPQHVEDVERRGSG